MLKHRVRRTWGWGERVETARKNRVAVAKVRAQGVRVERVRPAHEQLLGIRKPIAVGVSAVGARPVNEQLVSGRESVPIGIRVMRIRRRERMELKRGDIRRERVGRPRAAPEERTGEDIGDGIGTHTRKGVAAGNPPVGEELRLK